MSILDELFPDSARAAPSQVSTDSFDPLKFVQQNQALGTRAISNKYELQQQQLELNRLRQEQLQLGIDAKTKLANKGDLYAADNPYRFVTEPLVQLDAMAVQEGFKSYADAPLKVQKRLYELGASLSVSKNDPRTEIMYRQNMPSPTKGGPDTQTLRQSLVDPFISFGAGAVKGAGGLINLAGAGLDAVTDTNSFGGATADALRAAGTGTIKLTEKVQNALLSDASVKFNKDVGEAVNAEDVTGMIALMVKNPAALLQFGTDIFGQFAPGLGVGSAAVKGAQVAGKAEFIAKVGKGLLEYAQGVGKGATLAEKAAARAINTTYAGMQRTNIAIAGGLTEASGAVQETNAKSIQYLESQGIDPKSEQGRTFISEAEMTAAKYAGLIGLVSGAVLPSAEGYAAKVLTGRGREALASAATGGVRGAVSRVGATAVSEGLQELAVSPAAEVGVAVAKGDAITAEFLAKNTNPAEGVLGAIFGGGTKVIGGTGRRAIDAVQNRVNRSGADAATQDGLPPSDGSTPPPNPFANIADLIDASVNEVRSSANYQEAFGEAANVKTSDIRRATIVQGLATQTFAPIAEYAKSLGTGEAEIANLFKTHSERIQESILATSIVREESIVAELNSRALNGKTIKVPGIDSDVEIEIKISPLDYQQIIKTVIESSLRKPDGTVLKLKDVSTKEFTKKLLKNIDDAGIAEAAKRGEALRQQSPEQRFEAETQASYESLAGAYEGRLQNDLSLEARNDVVKELTKELDGLYKNATKKELSAESQGRQRALIEVLSGQVTRDGTLDRQTLNGMIDAVNKAFTRGKNVTAAELGQIAQMVAVRAEQDAARATSAEELQVAQADIAAANAAIAAAQANNAATARTELARVSAQQNAHEAAQSIKRLFDEADKALAGKYDPQTTKDIESLLNAAASKFSKAGDFESATSLRKKAAQLTATQTPKAAAKPASAKPDATPPKAAEPSAAKPDVAKPQEGGDSANAGKRDAVKERQTVIEVSKKLYGAALKVGGFNIRQDLGPRVNKISAQNKEAFTKNVNALLAKGYPAWVAGVFDAIGQGTGKFGAYVATIAAGDKPLSGTNVLVFNTKFSTENARKQQVIVAHELGHMIDFSYGKKGVDSYSTSDKWTQGYEQLQKLYADSDVTTEHSKLLKYPFGQEFDKYDSGTKRSEAFAQAIAMYFDEGYSAILKEKAPAAFEAIQGVVNEQVKDENQFAAGIGQAETNGLGGANRGVRNNSTRAAQLGKQGRSVQEIKIGDGQGQVVYSLDPNNYQGANPQQKQTVFANGLGVSGLAKDSIASRIKERRATIPSELQAQMAGALNRISNVYERGFVSPTFLSEAYKRLFGQQVVESWLNAMQDQAAVVDQTMVDVQSKIVEKTRRLKPQELGALVDVMAQSQLAALNPTKPLQKNATPEQTTIKAKYDKLPQAAKDAYKSGLKIFVDLRDAKNKVVKQMMDATANISAESKKSLIEALTGGYIDGYFPLRRQGQYAILVKKSDGTNLFFQKSDSIAELAALKVQLESEFKNKKYRVSAPFEAQQLFKQLDGASESFVKGFLATINQAFPDNGQSHIRDSLIEDLLVRHMQTSGKDSSLERKNVLFSQIDMLKGIAIEARKQSMIISSLSQRPKIAAALAAMEDQAKAAQFDRPADALEMSRAANILREHSGAAQLKDNTLSEKANGLVSLMFLGLSPAAAAINSLQLIQQTLPYLAGMRQRYGGKGGSSFAFLANGIARAVKLPKFLADAKTPEDKALLKVMEEMDIASPGDVTQAINLATYGATSGIQGKIAAAAPFINGMNEYVERLNRRATFIAAYDLATQAGQERSSALESAKNAVIQTQYVGSDANKPLFVKQKGDFVRMAYVLKTFSLSMYASLWRDVKNLRYDKTMSPEQRKEIVTRLKGQMAVQLLLAGPFSVVTPLSIAALTFFSAAMSAAGVDDDEFEFTLDARIPEERISQYVAKAFGEDASNLLTGGVPKALGLNIRGNLQQDFFFRSQLVPSDVGSNYFWDKTKELLPIIQIMQNGLNAAGELKQGDIQKTVQAVGQRGVNSLIKSYDALQNENFLIAKNGRIVAELSNPELFATALGFNSTNASNGQDKRGNELLAGKLYDNAKKQVADAVYLAVRISEMTDDDSAMEAARGIVEKFNDKYAKGDPDIELKFAKLLDSASKKSKKEWERFATGAPMTGSAAKDAYLERELSREKEE